MTVDLVAMARRKGIRRNVTVRPINPTTAQTQELARLYLAVIAVWSPDRILVGYSPDLTTDSPTDSSRTIERTDEEAKGLIVAFGVAVRQWAVRLERWHRIKWGAAVLAATGIELSTILTAGPMRETVEAFVQRNVALVTDVSDQARGRIADAVFRGYQQRQPAREVAKAIREAAGMARARSIRIASHQNANLSAAFDRERRAEAGLELFRWRHSGKKHPREHHKARDGLVYYSKSGKPWKRDGNAIPADDRAGVPPFCGCREQAFLPIMEEIGV